MKIKHQSLLQVCSIVFISYSQVPKVPKVPKICLFVISLQYLKKEGRDEVDFLHADKHQTILQVDTINFGGHGQA